MARLARAHKKPISSNLWVRITNIEREKRALDNIIAELMHEGETELAEEITYLSKKTEIITKRLRTAKEKLMEKDL